MQSNLPVQILDRRQAEPIVQSRSVSLYTYHLFVGGGGGVNLAGWIECRFVRRDATDQTWRQKKYTKAVKQKNKTQI